MYATRVLVPSTYEHDNAHPVGPSASRIPLATYAACDPAVEGADGGGTAGSIPGSGATAPAGGNVAGGVLVTLEPPSPLTAATSVFWLHVSADAALDGTAAALVSGTVSVRELRPQAPQGFSDAGKTVRSSMVWSTANGGSVVAPTDALPPGTGYTLALGDVSSTTAVQSRSPHRRRRPYLATRGSFGERVVRRLVRRRKSARR